MTEAEWAVCHDSHPMLAFVQRRGGVSNRKMLLFAVACCRRIWHLLYDGRSRKGVEAAERYADGDGALGRLEQLRTDAARAAFHAGMDGAEGDNTWYAAAEAAASVAHCYSSADGVAIQAASYAARARQPEHEAERAVQADLLRCVSGSPFRRMSFVDEWRTETVRALAAQMYESHEFGAMPILADALQDAGCNDEDILNHCRGTGPHVRGCWVIDLVLGKS
ncbi:MAG TPA: hypothetical protein VGE74_16615 [Gemmata sp.]